MKLLRKKKKTTPFWGACFIGSTPNEREILIEPERHFRVQSVIESNIVVVNLLMLDTPLILENQFNGGSENAGN